MIELKHLKTVQALKQAGSVAAAADLLHTTQSALSHQLKELEHRLSQSVFVRKSKPLQLTQAGDALLRLADQIMPLLLQTEAQLKRWSQGDGGRLHMAIECHSCFQWLFPALDEYRQLWPDVEVDFASGFHFDALQALADGELDLVITSDPIEQPELAYVPLFRYQNRLVVAPDNPLTKLSHIKAHDLLDTTLITYPVDAKRLTIYRDLLIPAGLAPRQVRQTELTLMMVQLVLSGRGVASLPEWVIAEYEHKAPLRSLPFEPALWSTLYAAIRTPATESYIQSFIDVAKASCFGTLHNIVRAD
ncbi:LysR family transcriptional regulator [Neiella marina]|uniref:HTH-type transcriptional regulator MetR n=1 Tax=Neiella holothuriorum TaxID=2870530 RepID=A0ABS7EID7_9GAMM|nr:LysR family transcriptional regulator [Neiella holothuriorum]MBW8192122.1 LysR family transcriptional regulator [Neiella holothuriorum]